MKYHMAAGKSAAHSTEMGSELDEVVQLQA